MTKTEPTHTKFGLLLKYEPFEDNIGNYLLNSTLTTESCPQRLVPIFNTATL